MRFGDLAVADSEPLALVARSSVRKTRRCGACRDDRASQPCPAVEKPVFFDHGSVEARAGLPRLRNAARIGPACGDPRMHLVADGPRQALGAAE
jgi:hypothetical protein